MSALARITISLPETLLHTAEAKLGHGEASRSALIRRILEDALKDAEEREQVEQYRRSYTEQPQTEEEIGWVVAAGLETLKRNPWVDDAR